MVEVVIPAGMVAWHGGDSAPADWDGGPVLGDDGDLYEADEDGGLDWRHGLSARDIGADLIAYTPRTDVADSQPHTNTVADSGAGVRCQQSERERVARIVALAGLGTITGEERKPHDNWEPGDFEARILTIVPKQVEDRCYAAADAILATLRAAPQSATDAADHKRNATSQSGLPQGGEVRDE